MRSLLIGFLAFFGSFLIWQATGTSISNGSGAPGGACVSGSLYIDNSNGDSWTCAASAWKKVANGTVLTGTTGTITGTLLAVGACNSGTATVTGAVVGQVVKANTTDGSFMSGSFQIHADVTSSNTVTVNICSVVAGTPPSKAYNVRVLQ